MPIHVSLPRPLGVAECIRGDECTSGEPFQGFRACGGAFLPRWMIFAPWKVLKAALQCPER